MTDWKNATVTPGPDGGTELSFDKNLSASDMYCAGNMTVVAITCRAVQDPSATLQELRAKGQLVNCDIFSGLYCKNSNQTCYDYEIQLECCSATCPNISTPVPTTEQPTTITPKTTAPTTTPEATTESTTTETTTPTTTPETTTETTVPETTTETTVPETTTETTIPETTTETTVPETTTETTVPETTTETTVPETTTETTVPETTTETTVPETTMETTTPETTTETTIPETTTETTVPETTTETTIPETTTPTTTTTTSTETTTFTSSTESATVTCIMLSPTTAPTTFSSSACYCMFGGELYKPGTKIRTDNIGIGCQDVVCSEDCKIIVEDYIYQCPSTTTPLILTSPEIPVQTTNPLQTTSTTKMCTFDPPRKYNETWMFSECMMARCIENNLIEITPKTCDPPPDIICANGFPPVNVTDDDGCCWHWECMCVCLGFGGPFYWTFDGTSYEFHGECTYVLVEEITEKINNFGIYVDNAYCGERSNCIRTIIIHYGTQTIEIEHNNLNSSMTQVAVNKNVVKIPYENFGVAVSRSETGCVVDITDLDVEIALLNNTFLLHLPYSYFRNNTQGLCGTCTNYKDDDCLLRNGSVTQNCATMAHSWIVVDPSKPECESTQTTTMNPTVTPPVCNASSLCELITGPTFQECHPRLPPDIFYNSCVFESCNFPGTNMECSIIYLYASICLNLGVCIDWRSKAPDCNMSCSPDKVYQPCGLVFPLTCQTEQNNKYFSEGCFCPNGTMQFSLAATVCVSTCGCVGPDNQPRQLGEKFEFNCQDCVCQEDSFGIVCKEKICPEVKTEVLCTLDGFYPVTQIDPNNHCCKETVCICDNRLCPEVFPECEIGYEVVSEYVNGSCCPQYKCVCNSNLCVMAFPTCQTGYEVVGEYVKGQCCPYYKCACNLKLCPTVQLDCMIGYEVVSEHVEESCCPHNKCVCNVSLCPKPVPICDVGYEVVGEYVDGHCCPNYNCVCNMKLCPTIVLDCMIGYEVVSEHVQGSCCPHKICVCNVSQCPKPLAKCDTGYEVVGEYVDGHCCPSYNCVCNSSLCTNTLPKCDLGSEVVAEYIDGYCCPHFKCAPKKVCVYGNAEYQLGSPVYSDPGSCQICVCSEDSTNNNVLNISCHPLPCSVHCPDGYKLRNDPGQCCGVCEQTHCVMKNGNSTELLEPGETRPLNDNCTLYSCTMEDNQIIQFIHKIACPPYFEEDCEPGTIHLEPNGCCKICIPRNQSCKLQKYNDYLSYQNCKTRTTVELFRCQGSCEAYSMYPHLSRHVIRKCSCCVESKTKQKTAHMDCTDGNSINFKYIDVDECQCLETSCNDEE
uniref:Mucin 2, oligomeric mucus/gel-forming n=1 Tax=Xenopus tropicalis TaxID=8364 RepID=A0A803J5N0_XENTR